MRSALSSVILIVLFISGLAATFPSFEESRRGIREVEKRGMTLPPVVIKLMSMEFRNIVADFLFVRVSQFYGGKVEEEARATKEDWLWLYRNLDAITELDPYFQDPYYVGNGLLTWDAGMFDEANRLLQKATDAREWDWWFPFFIGFNKFYFQGDNKGGADYLLKAYERPGAWPMLPSLAARLYYNDKRTENAIAFLTSFWQNETDLKVKKDYETRIDALRRVLFLEKAVEQYRESFAAPPESLEKLVTYGIIKGIPKDPYGGRFYIDLDGSVKSTSKLAFAHLKKNKEDSVPPDQSE